MKKTKKFLFIETAKLNFRKSVEAIGKVHVLLVMACMPVCAFADASEIRCKSANFPSEGGSELALRYDNGRLDKVYVHTNVAGPLAPSATYTRYLPGAEDLPNVTYLEWATGFMGFNSPKTIAIHRFIEGQNHNGNLKLGEISWDQNGRTEILHTLECL